MSLVDRHEIGMLSSVMRALKHTEAHALRRQRPSWRSSAAVVGSAIGVAVGPAASAGRCRSGTRLNTLRGGLRVTTPIETSVVRTTTVGHSTQSRYRSIRARWMLGTAPLHVSTAHPFSPAELERLKAYRLAVLTGFFSDWP